MPHLPDSGKHVRSILWQGRGVAQVWRKIVLMWGGICARSNAVWRFALGQIMADIRESTVTIRGQTTLPRAVRDVLRLQPGDRVRYLILEGGEVRILRTRSVDTLAGVLARPGDAVSLEEMERAIAEGSAG